VPQHRCRLHWNRASGSFTALYPARPEKNSSHLSEPVLPFSVMSEPQSVVVPRRKRDEATPPAPLDPYVTALVRWVAGQDSRGIASAGLARQAAAALGWEVAFAEAVLTATRGRRLLTPFQTGTSGGVRFMLSVRGRTWVNQAEQDIDRDDTTRER
jgi:hypothetical protein